MDTDMRAMAEEAAHLLLQHFWEQHKYWQEDKTPLDELIAWLGCHVGTFHPEDEPDGTYGYVDPDEDERLIWLRRNLPETLRRFTLAHELGHVILHCRGSQRAEHLPAGLAALLAAWDEQSVPELSHADPCHDNDVQESMTGLIDQEQFQNALGIGQQYDPRSQREIAANIFAAELLMPLELVHARYLEQAPASLAGTFVVSNAAMLNRLAGMLKTPATSVPEPREAQPEPASKPAKKQHDEFQRAAIEAPTPALIVAGPGSGKTSTLIGRAEYIMRGLGVPAPRILALTFSRKAAQEMEERLQQALDIDPAAAAHTPSSLPKVSTFHAFCADLLRQHGTKVGLREDFMLIDEAEGYFLLHQMANAMRLRHYQKLQAPAYYFPDMLKAISRAKDELISPEDYAQLAQRMLEQARDEEAIQKAEKALEVAAVYALYEQALERRGDSDFGGLLAMTVRLLREQPEVLRAQQQQYQHILVDEFQDVNRASGVLLRELAGEEQHVWVVGDANQCQPAGTMIRLPDGSECPIEQIQPNSEVVTYDRDSTMFVKKGKVTEVAVRPYNGMLYTVEAGDKQTRCTDSHKWLVRWTNREQAVWVTYLMRQGNRYRVGQTQLFLKARVDKRKSNGDLSLAMRVRNEKAEAAWILKVHDTLADALVYEQILSAKYGLPEVVFTQSYGSKCFTQEMIDKIYNSLPSLEEAARRCLADHGRKLEYPLYTREGTNGVQNTERQRQGRTTIFEAQACNLITGFMAIPVAPTHIHSKRDHSMRRVVAESWQPVEVTCEPFSGPVYSLNVAKYHKYIADGLVTCNSIYGFRGASPANIGNFTMDFPGAVVLPLSRNYRSRPDLVAIAESFRCVQLELGQEPGKNQPVRLTRDETYVTLAKATDEASELAGLVQDIRYKREHGFTYKDMIVLCRTRAQAQKVSRTLAKAGLPVIERGGMLEQEHIKDVLSIALLLTDASGMGILRAGRQSEHPLSQDDIETLLLAAREQKTSPGILISNGEAPLGMSAQGRRSLLRLSAILQTLRRAPDTWSLLAQYLFIETSLVRDRLYNRESKQDSTILADYDALLQLARHYDQQRRESFSETSRQNGEATERAATLEERARGFLDYLSLLVLLRQDGSNRQSSDEDSAEDAADIIRVMTTHASKGLEFPVVYMPGLVQRRFPMQARSSPVEAPAGMLPAESIGKAAHESGEACLFYVGVTRAREHLVLSYSEHYGKINYKRSLYLDALEAGLSDERIIKLRWENGLPAESDPEPLAPSSQPGEHFIAAMQPQTLRSSAIEAYQRCPRQYAYSSIYHFASETDGYQLFWQATQKTVEVLRAKMQESKQANTLPTQQEVQELYTRHWQELGGSDAPFGPMYQEHGQEIIETVRRMLSTQENITWDMRPQYNVDVAGKTVHVTVDRVESAAPAEAKPARFVRTRFGKRKDKPTADTRELFYMLAYRQHHPGQSVELHSHNMSTGEIAPITLSAKKEQSLRDEVEQSLRGLEEHAYPARPAEPFRCPTCPFFLICPA